MQPSVGFVAHAMWARGSCTFVFSLLCLAMVGGCGKPVAKLVCGEGTVEKDGQCSLTAPPISCGMGTVQQGAACIAVSTVCGEGTVPTDGGCALAPSAQIAQARLTFLKVKYDLAKPVFLNNPLPIRFGITSTSADLTKPVTTSVNVLFSFVEASPADPANPKSCDSNGVDLKLIGNGVEQQFDADIYPTGDCAAFVGSGAAVNLAVDFDRGLRLSSKPTGIDYGPVVFSSAAASTSVNQQCRKASNPNDVAPEKGCVYSLTLQPTPLGTDGKPLVDVKLDSLRPESSVAVLWPTQEDPDVPTGQRESDPPSLIVNAVLVMDGRDPYRNQIDPAKIPADLKASVPSIAEDLKFGLTDDELKALDNLPGNAVMKYDLVPSNKVSASAWLPLTIDDPKNPDPDGHVTQISLNELEPGTDNSFVHALYLEGDTRAAVSASGAWANDDDFTVRGCVVVDFVEGGNAGDADPDDAPVGGDVPQGDCRTFKVRLVKAPPPTGSASAHSFDMNWERTAGDPARIALIGKLRTSNTLDLNGARSDTEGTVEIKGNVGTDFGVQLFRAYAKAGALVTKGSSFVDVGVDAFGVNIFGYQNTSAEQSYSVPLMVAKSFQFPGLAFGFGPVSVGITAGVGGNVGLTPAFTVSAKEGGEPAEPALASASSSGLLQMTTTPSVGLTGNITGGIDLFIAKAAAVATVQVIDIGFPLTATLRWGVTELDASTMAVKKLTIVGELGWNLTINWLNVNVDLVGTVRLVFFNVTKTINIFKYENSPETVNLLSRKLGDPVVLE